ncbi:3-isopropylmalate dehydratase small subunit [soil metagenome]
MPQPLAVHAGLVVPMDRSNIDTDAILPKAFLKIIERTGLGRHLFDEARYLDAYDEAADEATLAARREAPDFVLNRHPYRHGTILLARANFGCGSSREHAPWALVEFGFRVVIAESFADIFQGNAVRNGLLPVALSRAEIDSLFRHADAESHLALTVDLVEQTVTAPGGERHRFEIAAQDRARVLSGKDEIASTLESADAIRAFEAGRLRAEPWV